MLTIASVPLLESIQPPCPMQPASPMEVDTATLGEEAGGKRRRREAPEEVLATVLEVVVSCSQRREVIFGSWHSKQSSDIPALLEY